MSVALAAMMLILLGIAAWRDFVTRTIPDAIGLLILVFGGVLRILNGPTALAVSAGTALLLFVLLMIAFDRGLIGGGDVKIITALAVGLPPLDSYRFVVATAIAGGILAIAYLVLSRRLRVLTTTKRSSLSRITAAESWRIRKRGPLPYGVAIAAGGAFVLLHPGSF